MFYVYILKSAKDRKLYFGYTRDLRKRLKQHNAHCSFSTKPRAPFRLIYYEAYASMPDAKKRENNLKLQANALNQLKRRITNSLNSLGVGV